LFKGITILEKLKEFFKVEYMLAESKALSAIKVEKLLGIYEKNFQGKVLELLNRRQLCLQ